MVKINQKMRVFLQKPVGKLYKNIENAKNEIANKRIIAVGDVVTLKLISKKIMPHLSVFDYQSKRKKLAKKYIVKLKKYFPKALPYVNTPGTISSKLIKDAKKLIEKGGGIRIIGEEDLTAIAFILAGSKKDRIIYGQPNKGIVIVQPNKIKKKLKKLLSVASFSHKV